MHTTKVSPERQIRLHTSCRATLLAALFSLLVPALGHAGGTPATGTTADQLILMGGADAPAENGDAISASDGLNTVYRFYIEVPPSQSTLQVDLFDADILASASDEVQERDRPRDNERTSVRYRLYNPAGTLTTDRFNYGDDANPPNSHGVWKKFYDNASAGITGGDTFRDNFTTRAYTNNDGSQNFANSWTETNDLGGGGATGGDIQVTTGGVLRIHNQSDPSPFTNQPRISREVNLSGYTAATVSFDFTSGSGVDALVAPASSGDSIAFEASSNGGTTYTVLEEFADISGTLTGARSYDVSEFIAANTRFRFRITMRYAGVNEYFEVDNFEVRATSSANGAGPANGHWLLEVDMSTAVNADQDRIATLRDDVNAFGIRAHDGTPGSGGTEYNVYAESFFIAGINRNNGARNYHLYPWVNAGCNIAEHDFDYDADLAPEGGANPNVQPYGNWTLTSRSGSFVATNVSMSANNAWSSQAIINWNSFNQAIDYGIWDFSIRIEDNGPGNYAPLYLTYNRDVGEPPPTSNPENGAYRLYLPSDAGTAPTKPYLTQRLTHVAQSGPNPPQVDLTTRFAVTVAMQNPSGATGSITFSNTNVITSRVPGGTTVYAGLQFVTQGSIVSQPAIGGSGDITWNPGTLAAGTTATMVYLIDVTPVAAVDILATGAFGSGNGTRAVYLDETGNGSQSRALTSLGELCELTIDADTPTPAVVSAFTAKGTAEGRLLEWHTAAEAGALSFDLYRGEGNEQPTTQVNAEPLLAQVDAVQGGTYQFLDRSANLEAKASYSLVENDSRGERRPYGPFRAEAAADATWAATPKTDYQRTPQASSALDQARRRDAARADPRAPTAKTLRPASRGDSKAAYKIAISQEGFYHLPMAQLTGLFGLNPGAVRQLLFSGGFDLRRGGQPVAWATWGEDLAFWAQPSESPFYSESLYWLRLGQGRKVEGYRGTPPPPDGASSVSRDTLRLERDVRPLVLMSLDPDGDFFFWDYLAPGGAAASRSFNLELPAVSAFAGPAQLLFDFQGAAEGNHLLAATLNGNPLGQLSLSGKSRAQPSLEVPAGVLQSGNNVLQLQSLAGGLVFFDHVEITFDRNLMASGNQLVARFGSTRFTSVTGFTSPEVLLFDLADADRPVRLLQAKTRGELGGSFRLDFENRAAGGRFVALSQQALRPVPAPELDVASDLRSPQNIADYLVIAPPALLAAAQDIAHYRTRSGLRTQVVSLVDIYDEFAAGHHDPRAIRDFLAFAHHSWQVAPAYVLLAGSGSYDWRDLQGYGDNLLPMLMVDRGGSLFPSDSRFADLEGGDGVPEIALGRVPALSAAELEDYLAKLIAYETTKAAWQNQVLLLADGVDANFDFAAEGRQMSELLPRGYDHQVLALAENASLAQARSQLFGALGEGRAWLTYVGHGGVDRLSSQGLLTKADIPALTNSGKLFVLQAVSCHVGLHGLPGYDSLGEDLVIDPAAGAVAAFAPAWLSEHDQAKYLADRLLREVFQQRRPRLGDAIREAMASAAQNGVPTSLLSAYQLIGDPALELRLDPQAPPPPPNCWPNCGQG